MTPGYLVMSENEIHGVSARNSRKRNAREMTFKTDYKPILDLFKNRHYVMQFVNDLIPFPGFLTFECNEDEMLSEFIIIRIDENTAKVFFYIEKSNF